MDNNSKLPDHVSKWIDEYAGVFAYENGSEKNFDELKSYAEDIAKATWDRFGSKDTITGWRKWMIEYPSKAGLYNVILRDKNESWVAYWNPHNRRFEEACPEFTDRGIAVEFWQPLPSPPTQQLSNR